MADMNQKNEATTFWQRIPLTARLYAIFCVVVVISMAWANYAGWFPTYGIFSGENSMHRRYFGGSYGGGYTTHGK